MMTVIQAAAKLQVSASLVYGWCEDYMLPHYRMGSKGNWEKS
jgi:excisionase family DNA binding protein